MAAANWCLRWKCWIFPLFQQKCKCFLASSDSTVGHFSFLPLASGGKKSIGTFLCVVNTIIPLASVSCCVSNARQRTTTQGGLVLVVSCPLCLPQHHGDGARGGLPGHHTPGGGRLRVAALCRGTLDWHLSPCAQTALLHCPAQGDAGWRWEKTLILEQEKLLLGRDCVNSAEVQWFPICGVTAGGLLEVVYNEDINCFQCLILSISLTLLING